MIHSVAARVAITSLFCLSAAARALAGPLESLAQSFVDQHIAAGVVLLVADKDRVLTTEAAGYASLASRTPMRPDGVFWIASMSKSFTGTALMMLVDEGKVNLDDPVEKYLPEFKAQMMLGPKETDPLRRPGHPITVREIMDHTSGLVQASDKSLKRMHSLADEVAQYAARPLRYEPGTKYHYNNSGIDTAGRIIEVVSGLPYAEFIERRLVEPLGMKDTTCWPNEEQAARLAHTVRRSEGGDLVELKQDENVKPEVVAKWSGGTHVPAAVRADMGAGIALDYAKRYANPAGGYFSTAPDLARFCRMLLRGGELDGRRYLSEKAVREMSSVQTGGLKVSPVEGYGIGWMITTSQEDGLGPGSFGHRGARRTAMWIEPREGLALIVLAERFDMPANEQRVMYSGFFKAAIDQWGRGRSR